MVDVRNFFKEISRSPGRFYIVHYSSQGLYDDRVGGLSPRITSIVVMHYETKQTMSFALHAVAEYLHISKEELDSNIDKIEKEILERFYEFVRDRREKYWVHWNMKNITYGFEHLALRYHKLSGAEPPHIPVEVRLDLNDVLKERHGSDFVERPRMKNLMLLQGPLDGRFLEGAQEADCFAKQEFIRMHNSTISKVEFFRHVIDMSIKGKLRTAGRGIAQRIDRLLESRSSRVCAFFGTLLGILVGIYQFVLWLR